MALNADEIYRRLRYHPPKGNQTEVYELIRRATIDYATAVAQALPESQEKSTWFTLLETAQMWANKAIAVNGAHVEEESKDG
jgi:hypothetical protein